MQSVLEGTKVSAVSNVVAKTNVFVSGVHKATSITLEQSKTVPRPLLIYYPDLEGTYPVLLFLHGFSLSNDFYSNLLEHVSSHGYIVVAPQLYSFILIPPGGEEDVKAGRAVADWLPTGLQSKLPDGVTPDLQNVALAGHSRGGQGAFALALRAQTIIAFKLLIGIDPVSGSNNFTRTDPEVLTYMPQSFDLSIPVAVIGTGLGSQRKSLLMPPCAPVGLSHDEFFNECKPPCYHFVAKDYGHMDMLNDGLCGPFGSMAACMCKDGTGPKDDMRKGVGGIVVALLNAWLGGQDQDLVDLVAKPEIAPIVLDPVQYVPA